MKVKSLLTTADNLAAHIETIVSDAEKCVDTAQQRQTAYADRSRRNLTFGVESEVLLNIKGTSKLLPRWVGSFKLLLLFKIKQRINPVAHKQA